MLTLPLLSYYSNDIHLQTSVVRTVTFDLADMVDVSKQLTHQHIQFV